MPLTYTLSGDIPAGLRFDLGSRTLSGTPTTTTPATLTYRVTAANGITDQRSFTLSFTPNPGPFVTQWVVGASQNITIPTIGSGNSYDYAVTWGDGAVTTAVTSNASHTYAEAGTYSVVISGDFPRINFNNGGDRNAIRVIEQWGSGAWSSMESAFYGCANLTIAATAGNPDLSAVTSLQQMFRGATVMNSPTLSSWDVSKVTTMQGMFVGAESFNQNLNGWTVSKVTDMSSMFFNATAYNQPMSTWEVGEVTNMQSMFSNATAFNQGIGDWDVRAVTTMRNMFRGATAFNQDIGRWEVGAVTTMWSMFFNATAFNQDIGGWEVGAVTTMWSMFFNATAFNQDIGGWDVGMVDTMWSMFFNATAFNQDISGWDVGTVTTMVRMFAGVTLSTANYDALLAGWSQVDTDESPLQLEVNFDAGGSLFCDLTARQSLTALPTDWTITDGGVDPECTEPFITTWAVSGDREITIPVANADDDPNLVYDYFVYWGDGTDPTRHNGNATHTYLAAGTYTISIFGEFPRIQFARPTGQDPSVERFEGAEDKDRILTIKSWGNNPWTSMEYAFAFCRNLTIESGAGVPILTNVTSTERMFYSARRVNQGINNQWQVGNVRNMRGMFTDARAFNQDINGWTVSNVTDMSQMFRRRARLQSEPQRLDSE